MFSVFAYRRIRSWIRFRTSYYWIRIWIQEARKHTDPAPDPQHCYLPEAESKEKHGVGSYAGVDYNLAYCMSRPKLAQFSYIKFCKISCLFYFRCSRKLSVILFILTIKFYTASVAVFRIRMFLGLPDLDP